MPDLRPSDESERVIAPGETRWAIYDRPTRTLWFGGPATKTHLTVAEESFVPRIELLRAAFAFRELLPR